MILKIVDIKNPILKKRAKPVGTLDKKIKKLIADMKNTLAIQEDPEGVGLAAPQVGRGLQIFVMNHKNIKMKVVINPKVISRLASPKSSTKANKSSKILEGCLSIPYFYGPVKRSQKIKLEYTNEEGKKVVEEFTDFAAHIVEHELEHLEGKLFIEHILANNSPLYRIEGDDWEEVEL